MLCRASFASAEIVGGGDAGRIPISQRITRTAPSVGRLDKEQAAAQDSPGLTRGMVVRRVPSVVRRTSACTRAEEDPGNDTGLCVLGVFGHFAGTSLVKDLARRR